MDAAVNYPRWIMSEFEPFLKGDVAEVGAGSGNSREASDFMTVLAFRLRGWSKKCCRYRLGKT